MRKIVLILAFVAVTFSAQAWSSVFDKAVLLLASENYSPKTYRLITHYVHEDHTKPYNHLGWHRRNGRLLHTAGWHTLHLDKNHQPAAKDDNDAVVQIEKALEIVRNHNKYEHAEVSLAIQIVMNLIIDMHNLSNVVIEDIPLSGTDFKVTISSGTAGGRPAKLRPYSWRILWTHRYNVFHGAYSPAMYKEDLNIMFSNKKEEFSKGNLNDWCNDIGSYTRGVYRLLEQNNGQFLHAAIQEHEALHMSCLAKAAYRIAVLMNENLK